MAPKDVPPRNELCVQLQQNYLEDMKEVIELLSVLRQKHIDELKQVYESDELLIDNDLTNKASTTHTKDCSVNYNSFDTQDRSTTIHQGNNQNTQNESNTSTNLRKHYHRKLHSLMKQMQKTAKLMHNISLKPKHKRNEEDTRQKETAQIPQENIVKEYPYKRETPSRVRFRTLNDYNTYLATPKKQYVHKKVGKISKHNVATDPGITLLSKSQAKKQMYGFSDKASPLVANVSVETLGHYGDARIVQHNLPKDHSYLNKRRKAKNHILVYDANKSSNAANRQVLNPTKFLQTSYINHDSSPHEPLEPREIYLTSQENVRKPIKTVMPKHETAQQKEHLVDDTKYVRVKKHSINERNNNNILHCNGTEEKSTEIYRKSFPKKERNYKLNTNISELKDNIHTTPEIMLNVSQILETQANPFQSDNTSPNKGFVERKLLPQISSSCVRDHGFCPCSTKKRRCTSEKRYCKSTKTSNKNKENTLIVTDFNPMENSKVISVNIIFKNPKQSNDKEKVKKERVNKGICKQNLLQKKQSNSSNCSSKNDIEAAQKCMKCDDGLDNIDIEGRQEIEQIGEYYCCCNPNMINTARSPVQSVNTIFRNSCDKIKPESKRTSPFFNPKRRHMEGKSPVDIFYFDESNKEYDKISDFSDNETYLILT